MADDSLDRLQALIERAREVSRERRAAWLREQLATQPRMRAAIEALLRIPGSFEVLDETVTATEPAAARSPQAGERYGHYRVLERIGEGAFGYVYKAERREPMRQIVALKVLKPGLETGGVLARFEGERQALAMMQHPNVARIIDAGSGVDGRPYFAMEYIAGVPVTEHCDRHRLSLSERLRLFERICGGAQHAHQKGVIHRDIKPSNVLVHYEDGIATPKIIDFGVAKAINQPLTARTLVTERGQLIGTPEYMSPEQVEGTQQDIDTRSDVYSLGVLLYQLLTGALPFDRQREEGAVVQALLERIRDSDPPRPSTRLDTEEAELSTETARLRSLDRRTLIRRLRGDLDWITMKCLEKDRARRYGSPNELAADLRRHQEERPVLAGPPSLGYRTRKLWRRHRGRIVAGTLVAVAALVGPITATALTVSRVQLQGELNDRRAEELIEEAGWLSFGYRDDARDRLEQAATLVGDTVEVRLARAQLLRLERRFDEALVEARAALDENSGSGRAAAFLAGLLVERDPRESARLRAQAERQLERPELNLALAVGTAGDAEAIDLLTASLDEQPWNYEALSQRCMRRYLADDFAGARDDATLMTKVRGDLAAAWLLRGAILLKEDGFDEGATAEERAPRLKQALSHLDQAVRLDDGEWTAFYDRGLAHARLGDFEAALADFESGLALGSQAIVLHQERAWALLESGDPSAAVKAYDEVLALGQDDWATRWDRGILRMEARDFEGALEDFTAALADLPEVESYAPDRVDLLTNRGLLYLVLEDYDASRADLDAAYALAPDEAVTQDLMGRLSWRLGRFDEAIRHGDRAVALAPGEVNYRLGRGIARWMAGRTREAAEDFAVFAAADPVDGPWWRIPIWQEETRRGNAAAASAQLDAAARASEDPLLAAVLRALRGDTSPDSVAAAASTAEDQRRAYFALGYGALAKEDAERAVHWFGRCVDLGHVRHLEHDVAAWHLARRGG